MGCRRGDSTKVDVGARRILDTCGRPKLGVGRIGTKSGGSLRLTTSIPSVGTFSDPEATDGLGVARRSGEPDEHRLP